MSQAPRDQNFVPTVLLESSSTPGVVIPAKGDEITGRLLVDIPSDGTVTSVSVVTANGFAGSVATATTTPAITLTTTINGILKGNGTAISAITVGSGLSYDGTTLSATGTAPGGSDTQVQYNNSSAFGGITNATTNGTTLTLTSGRATTDFSPSSNDAASLGTTALGFSDLHLASGGVINWANGTLTLTQSSSTLTLVGTTLVVDSSGTATHAIDRGATTNFASFVYRTAGTDQWSVQLRNDSTNNLYIRDNVNGVNILQAAQGATPAITTGGVWSFTTIKLGSGGATDTTLSRDAAGVLAVEGIVVPTISSTNTLTNKRVTRRITTTNAPGATPTTNTDNVDIMNFTGLDTAITSMTTNLSGTPSDGDLLEFRFLDNGTARAITWGSSFAATTIALPTTTVISTCLRVGFEWRAASSKWECIATC